MKKFSLISAVTILAMTSLFTSGDQPKKAINRQKSQVRSPAKASVQSSALKPSAAKAHEQPAVKADMKKAFPYEIHQQMLPNGLNVVTVPYPSQGIAAFYIVVRAGSRNEVEAGKTGFAHFFEHMMFRGTDLYPKEKYNAVLKSTGASANANTSLDRTLYHMTGDASKLETMFMLESDRFKNLSYSMQDFKTEAGAVKGEYTKNSANPYTKLNELTQNTAFDSHTYKHTTMGFFNDIVDMPNQYEYSREFFSRYYRPEFCTVIVVGDATPEKVNAPATKYFGDWKRGTYQSVVSPEPPQTATRYVNLQKPGFPPYLGLNYKGPAFSETEIDFPALDILCDAYFGENSDLYNKLVINEKKLRSLGADATTTRDPYLISVEGSLVNAADFNYIKNEMERTLNEAKNKPLDAKILNETKENFRNSMIMRTDNPTSIAQTLSFFTWISGNPESINTYYGMYDKVTANDIMNIAKKYFTPERLTVATISADEKVNFNTEKK
jgi:zinc protease